MSGAEEPGRGEGAAWSEREQLAAEYVLGTQPAAERAAVAQRLGEDPVLARLVEAWQARLAPLDAGTPAVAPPPELWPRLAEALSSRVLAHGEAPPGGHEAAAAAELAALRRTLRRQRLAIAGLAALAAALALLLLLDPPGGGLPGL